MKKGMLALIIIVVILLAGGVGVYLAKHATRSSMQSIASATPTPSNMFHSLADALANKSLSLSCDFTTTSGIHVMAYIKNGAIRSDITGKSAQESGSVIIKDKKMYFWNAQMGMMMDMVDMTVTPTPTSGTGSSTSPTQNTLANLEQYKDSCKPEVVADSLFTLPTNVKFTDESQMMHTMPSVMPTGSGNYAVPTQYQHYMQHVPQAQ